MGEPKRARRSGIGPVRTSSASFLYADGLLSVFPPDHEFEGYCRARFYSRLFSGSVAGCAGKVENAVLAERVVVDAVFFQKPYVPKKPSGRRVGAQSHHVLEESRYGREATPAHEVVFGAVAWCRPLRGVVLPECSGLFEDPYHVVEVLAGDLVRQVVVAGPVESP